VKITKRQLRRIIKEEKAKLLNESSDAQAQQLLLLHDTIARLWQIMGPDELANELFGIAEDIRSEALAGRRQRGE
jgi:hypothetical protein